MMPCMMKFLALIVLLSLPACAPAHDPSVPSAPRAADEVNYYCETEADCAVKDVGNCCGYFPACVSRDSPTFPERVQAECRKSNMAGVCGFPDISHCHCVKNRCTHVADSDQSQ
jgi:hypothetical protein